MELFVDIVTGVLLLTAASLTLAAAVGLYRLPDVYTRIHVATKPITLGLLCSLVATVLQKSAAADLTKLVLAVLLLFTTVPVAASMLARAAHTSRVPLDDRCELDELGDHLGSG
jgi:multicomponent Na+:H+ antiporter subunit G